MNSKLGFRRTAITAVFLAASAATGLAFAVEENESNGSIADAQRLEIGPDGTAEVTGVIGNATGLVIADVDFYFFEGRVGDMVTIDIDGGMKPRFSGLRSVDTVIAIFGEGGKKLFESFDAGLPLDPGSVHEFDARIDNFRLPASGRYTIGVSSSPRNFLDGGTLESNVLGPNANGSYTLRISGVSPSVLDIKVEIKPSNSSESASINPMSKGNIRVALLSSSEFNAPEVDQQLLRFGAVGNEESLLRCNKDNTDVNGDGRPDLVCHFDTRTAGFVDTRTAGFEPGDIKGIATGSLKDGRRFKGRGEFKVVPVKRQ